MSLKIFLFSDTHVGMKFRNYPISNELIQARFDAVANAVSIANQNKCNLLVIAGDLFESVTASRKDVLAVVNEINKFDGALTLVLPGNHDNLSGEKLWENFSNNMAENVLLLEESGVYDFTINEKDIAVYPAPCDMKRSKQNSISWIKNIKKNPEIDFHIGIAHGSVSDISADFDKNYFPMTKEEINALKLDLFLFGHTHISYPAIHGGKENIFCAGTTEPDGWDCKHEGYSWIIELNDDKKVTSKKVQTGKFKFHDIEKHVDSIEDIDNFINSFSEEDHSNSLLRVKLKGRLSSEEYLQLEAKRKSLEDSVFYLQHDFSEITKKITPEVIDKEFAKASFPHKLLSEFCDDEQDFEALQIAYDLIQRVKK